jgi:vacuolar-type H+-ATPase subunit I/STV1
LFVVSARALQNPQSFLTVCLSSEWSLPKREEERERKLHKMQEERDLDRVLLDETTSKLDETTSKLDETTSKLEQLQIADEEFKVESRAQMSAMQAQIAQFVQFQAAQQASNK